MPVKYRRPEWEREDNRTIIFTTLFEKSMTFTELRGETGFAKSTLSNHLKDLQAYGAIKKALENDRVVYRTTINEKVLESEFKRVSFDWFLKLISLENPELVELIETMMRLVIKYFIVLKKRALEGIPQLPLDANEVVQYFWSESTQKDKEILARSSSLLRRFDELIEPELKKLIVRGVIKETNV